MLWGVVWLPHTLHRMTLYDPSGLPLPPAVELQGDTADAVGREIGLHLFDAMGRLTRAGAKADRNGMDSVRVSTSDLHALCTALFVFVRGAALPGEPLSQDGAA